MRTIPVAVALGSVLALAGCAAQAPSVPGDAASSAAMIEASSQAQMEVSSAPAAMKASEAMKQPEASVRVIEVTATDWSFSPASITVKKGEKVSIKLVGEDGTHGLAIPGMGINERITAGATALITLNTDTPGTYDGYCSVPCGPGHRDMKFSVIVTG